MTVATKTDDPADTRAEFDSVVNMTGGELKRWLETDESRSVGDARNGGESVGHDSARRIVGLLAKRVGDLDDDDYAHMRKVIGYVHRHLAQRPQRESVEDSRWRYSLMNWGHDPLKK